jgi:hypothetical protein
VLISGLFGEPPEDAFDRQDRALRDLALGRGGAGEGRSPTFERTLTLLLFPIFSGGETLEQEVDPVVPLPATTQVRGGTSKSLPTACSR